MMERCSQRTRRRLAVAYGDEINFRFNPTKCEVMNCTEPVFIYGERVPQCTQFKYLGVWFGEGGTDWFLHCSKMIDNARQQLNFWRSIGFNGGGFGLRTRRMIYTTFLRPVVEYGLAVTPKIGRIFAALERFKGTPLWRCMASVETPAARR